MASRKISVSGFRQSLSFQKAANAVVATEHLFPTTFKADVVEFPDKPSYDEWLIKAKTKLGPAAARHDDCPVVWKNDPIEYVGGLDECLSLLRLEMSGASAPVSKRARTNDASINSDVVSTNDSTAYDFDLVVIGGGSGGLACSKRAAELGMKVAVLDYVKPSWQGTTWGLGGTCVNVGCIPKKLFHAAATHSESVLEARDVFGFVDVSLGNNDVPKADWATLKQHVNDHVRSLNFGYRVQLREKAVKYVNAFGTFHDSHTVLTTEEDGSQATITSRRFVIAVGGRPNALKIPGGELAVSSDDLFTLEDSPGDTLVVGASYVALECAGFLKGIGLDVTVMVRSILLRGFDQQIANMIGAYMEKHGVKFLKSKTPSKLEKLDDGKIRVFDQNSEEVGVFDTVLVAVGRHAVTGQLDLKKAGLIADEKTGKFDTNEHDQTNVAHIYAIGDVRLGNLELTPIAINSGKLLADRLFNNSLKLMDYHNVCTTIFTPIEYGCVGLCEEDAIEKFGDDNVEVYHSHFQPLEHAMSHVMRDVNDCYAKVLVDKSSASGTVVGLHYLGPNAGEVLQGFGVAMKMGMTYDDLVSTVGIHPTVAEELTKLDITKRSGESPQKSGC